MIYALHQMSSGLAVIACMWLVHVNAAQGGRWNQCIAVGYAILATALAAAMFGRFFALPWPWLDLIFITSKLTLAGVLFAVAIRREFVESR